MEGYQAEILELDWVRQLVLLRDPPLPVRVQLRGVQTGSGTPGVHGLLAHVLLPRGLRQLQVGR